MNVVIPNRVPLKDARGKEGIIDCDIHPRYNSNKDLYPFLSKRWRDYIDIYGMSQHHGFRNSGSPYPKGNVKGDRGDSYPPNGSKPAGDLPFLQTQLLDGDNIDFGILNMTGATGADFQNGDLGQAVCSAVNDWLVDYWTSKEPRLRASMLICYEDPAAAIAEIERLAGNPAFVQILILSRTAELLGRKRYWPIYEAAIAHNLPIAIHTFGYGGNPITGAGWPSFYIEEMVGHSQTCQAHVSSLALEGVFERYPELKVVLVESGFAWIPPLLWRLDRNWARNRTELPHVTRPPSETILEHVWVTTQPIEEPEARGDLSELMNWIGMGRLMFATDYPHWDYDSPSFAIPLDWPADLRRQLMRGNAEKLYGFK